VRAFFPDGCDGFTLIELAVVVFITGLMLAAASMLATPILREARQMETQQKLENIARAIDYYAAQNLRLPCPALPDAKTSNPPFGFESGSGPAGNSVPSDCGASPAQWEGIVPFRTLNIPLDWIRDTGSHYITYAISPGFSQDVSRAALPVHSRCRTADWFAAGAVYEKNITDPETGQQAANVLLPKTAEKARFCCSGAMPGTDLVILDGLGQPLVAVPRQTAPASYNAANITFPNPYAANVPVAQDDRVTAPVYVLVSHGSHGGGAWTGSGRTRYPVEHATLAETENANGNRTFVEILPADRAGAEKAFDDIVLWRTQDMIFTSQGKSCSLP
jgi:prepilin-type N-terminal cleavage/methylation domain-containing protein